MNMLTFLLWLAVFQFQVLLVSSQDIGGAALHLRHRKLAPPSDSSAVVARQFIVTFTSHVKDPTAKADELIQTNITAGVKTAASGAKLLHVYQHALHGFAVANVGAFLLAKILEDSSVLQVTPDEKVQAWATQNNPPAWGLDRLDQASLPLNSQYNYTYTGQGVDAYVIDTGIRVTHTDFLGPDGQTRAFCGSGTSYGTCNDGYGHGTHVAGTIGGKKYGLAKEVTLYAVKVLSDSGSGSYADVIAGVDFVTGRKKANPGRPAVANMSLGGSVSTPLNNAVHAAVAAGVVFAVAAGNSAANACSFSPASAEAALTVGATTTSDSRDTSYSNYGPCIDVFAPGSNIKSAWRTSDTATNTISGTSMASPHVAGVAALYLSKFPTANATEINQYIVNDALMNVLKNVGTGSPNKMVTVTTLQDGAATAYPTAAPVAPAPTPTCNAWLAVCTSNSQCCSGRCRVGLGWCTLS